MKYLLFLSLAFALLGFKFSNDTAYDIYGTVTDSTGAPIPGVSVNEKGTKHGTSTDAHGNFHLHVKTDSVVLEISYIGYETKEVLAVAGNKLTVQLNASSQVLNEVVVKGYYTASKKDLVGSVRTTAPGMLADKEAQYDMMAAAPLQGRVAGLQVKGHYRKIEEKRFNREGYAHIEENRFMKVKDAPLSTFSIDVDAASYSNIRRFIQAGELPPAGAVRIEEMVNYFHYNYPQPTGSDPFSVNTALSVCPWNTKHQLLQIGLQGKIIPRESLPPANLVFLVDVSGSMMEENKLPLVQSSLKLLTDQLRPEDRVALVAYAGNAGLVLPSTSGAEKNIIKTAIAQLEAGGSTAGGAGIQLAYKVAREQFKAKGNNRVILCTDGDFNVGASSDDALVRMIEKEREGGVFLTVLGFGTGNYQDAKMEQLADKGNGNHAYIDGMNEARKVLGHEFGGTLFTIAKDVKLQLEFNPAQVQGYRLIGYENRMLAKEDFNNDKKDAGELGSGHTVTALYELIPAGAAASELDSVDQLRYQPVAAAASKQPVSKELLNIKLRYKQPDGETSKLIQYAVQPGAVAFDKAPENLRFAAAVAAFGMQLCDSKFRGTLDYNGILKIARNAVGNDTENYRSEFVQLVQKARSLPTASVKHGDDDDDEDE
ncbi:vWA domain-containing protein [Deminuibacter soli]|uniref:DUF3520 domain-containing protein n=1 Tax=Deminuibacter soli TaxID=2291815 RepID=A0A3E1NL20_9BACT|nr:VWA domain-containing protein [Deminuibacter soli]RFM28607.1 DUF3520 domain-containing protein [Deminuibacter soli]